MFQNFFFNNLRCVASYLKILIKELVYASKEIKKHELSCIIIRKLGKKFHQILAQV